MLIIPKGRLYGLRLELFDFVSESEGFGWGRKGDCVKHYKHNVYFLLVGRGGAIEVHISAKGRIGKLGIRDACYDLI